MYDRVAQKAILARENKVDSMKWICGYDPVASWNKPPVFPAIE
jgi:hypothetical protein